ncbi:MAG: FAD-dependent 5-carboxymethylaminomethyl-2-thiouridine(34) oxidoreductase MnmC [Hylemonella sp.]|uniref:FAD-dependent 5-carboxymethylaminomethyl-2-thiouridine(34) oxidoreductase MnmC n=1 Tax=Hylemonella sp. TaxID=2066020 RepID=UPI0022C88385|nr:FAD-dependent 5-carboxymethylaminomethyl-2-thiouridine(34) oxidoreductase MnmC [Hylemonella sp.]MCZ8253898.1 FAD-dependent 5-carboxymethylaminomethyl-2-thiouridine(34) oxidoreductase MnmC [Hylemonella sp.]
MNPAAHPLLPLSPNLPVWRVLDTRLDVSRLLALWQAWRELPARPRVLHLVAFAPEAPPRATLYHATEAKTQPLVEALAAQWLGLLPGMHRLLLDDGHFQLTLCIGELAPLLRAQHFAADAIHLDPALPWDGYSLKALARCRRRGTLLQGPAHDSPLAPALRELGFVTSEQGWCCDPAWALRQREARIEAAPVGRCAVIGAGLAGASVAAALARRGWQVQVLDAAAEAAAGASGLPAGLLIPHVSTSDGPRSRLTRAGLRLVRAEAQRLLRAGEDWGPTGVLELRLEGKSGLPEDWPANGHELTRSAALGAPEAWKRGLPDAPTLWHGQAAWIKPAQLVRAWLAQPGVRFRGNGQVDSLRATPAGWELRDAQGHVLDTADQVVLANALDAPRLLATAGCTLPPLHGMRGVLSWGLRETTLPSSPTGALPPHPVNGAGSFIPDVPVDGGRAWYAGATYENTADAAAPQAVHLQANLEKLRRLLPAVADALAPAYADGLVQAWEAVRCVSRNRLPLVGPLQDGPQPTLWISAAMGSRGLSLCMLCAELLAARLGAEPWPLETGLAQALDLRRKA